MQLEQRFWLAHPPAVVWPQFQDIPALVGCLPGASLTGPVEGSTVPLRFDVKLGPISAGFVGAGSVTFDEAARTGVFDGSAVDRRTNSRVKGAANFQVLPGAKEGCDVVVVVDYTLTGPLAQFGRAGIVRELAGALTAQFASRLEQRLGGPAPTDAGAGVPEARPAAPGAQGAQPLSVMGLLGQVLRRLWARWFRRAT
jgi:uncharacterized protein